MATNIFVNFTTNDLDRSKAFYEALGYTINPLFTDDNAACVVLSDTIYFMVQTREFYATFTDKEIIDPRTQAGASIALSQDSREGSTPSSPGASKRAASSRARPRTTASCTPATWRTRTATTCPTSTWLPRPPRRVRRRTWQSREPALRPRPDTRMAARSPRGFGQSGGVARALERVGERWALLIVRDLLAGARRYSDLKAGLPRIPTNILSDRLKELQEAGVIRRVPTVRGGYELTPLGRELRAGRARAGAVGMGAGRRDGRERPCSRRMRSP